MSSEISNILYRYRPLRLQESFDKTGLKYSTPDITFADNIEKDIHSKKNVYKVYVTYKSNGHSSIKVLGFIDGEETFGNGKEFSISNSTNYSYGSGTTNIGLSTTSGNWAKATLVPNTPSDFKGINSLRLYFYSTEGSTPGDFSINDISIVYRLRSVR